jgi:hypothetical protein
MRSLRCARPGDPARAEGAAGSRGQGRRGGIRRERGPNCGPLDPISQQRRQGTPVDRLHHQQTKGRKVVDRTGQAQGVPFRNHGGRQPGEAQEDPPAACLLEESALQRRVPLLLPQAAVSPVAEDAGAMNLPFMIQSDTLDVCAESLLDRAVESGAHVDLVADPLLPLREGKPVRLRSSLFRPRHAHPGRLVEDPLRFVEKKGDLLLPVRPLNAEGGGRRGEERGGFEQPDPFRARRVRVQVLFQEETPRLRESFDRSENPQRGDTQGSQETAYIQRGVPQRHLVEIDQPDLRPVHQDVGVMEVPVHRPQDGAAGLDLAADAVPEGLDALPVVEPDAGEEIAPSIQ